MMRFEWGITSEMNKDRYYCSTHSNSNPKRSRDSERKENLMIKIGEKNINMMEFFFHKEKAKEITYCFKEFLSVKWMKSSIDSSTNSP